jgi:hypothetical protein
MWKRPTQPEITNNKTSMTDLNNAFEEAVKESKQLPSKPDNETLLRLYYIIQTGNRR